MNKTVLSFVVLAAWLSVIFFGCTSAAVNYSNHPYIENKPLTVWNHPFSAIWLDKSISKTPYPVNKIYVEPASVYLSGEHSQSETNAARQLCAFLNDTFSELAKERDLKCLVSNRSESDIFLKPKIIDIERTHCIISYCSLGTSLFVPYVSYMLEYFVAGKMTMAVKLFETSTNKELAIMVDYRKDEPTLFGSFRDYTFYGQHKKTVRMWADRLCVLLASPPRQGAEPPIWFTINPF